MDVDNNITIDLKIINKIAKSYTPLDYGVRLVELLEKVYPSSTIKGLSKYELHKLLNETLLINFGGEQVFKYKLFQQFYCKANIVAAFEIKVNNSRADFLAINGHTTCFEIKTSLDNFSKFNKQAADYLSAFEYNYLVVDESHFKKAQEVIPNSFGLLVYKNGKNRKEKGAVLNDQINPEVQLELLTKMELLANFPDQLGNKKSILNEFNNQAINLRFKKILKNRYRSRWEFLVNNQGGIFPIDLQFFFNTNILPSDIYYH
jgi:hypothetical protein